MADRVGAFGQTPLGTCRKYDPTAHPPIHSSTLFNLGLYLLADPLQDVDVHEDDLIWIIPAFCPLSLRIVGLINPQTVRAGLADCSVPCNSLTAKPTPTNDRT
ncbi:hypothetical protein K9N68_25980 [Kovacikia minuta CCNUW1]|uniref:hypothetical protein n=1 Tax=Kovacikia minuta TaxID=2931930 RepID=UPI001CCE159E|nr:hypothetical protein [Kovacikia minuta]UBF25057.1 hypothetical protein K9N68_25980 [Kovacikia minuta CCNUW1]